jgi:hypothetical protein
MVKIFQWSGQYFGFIKNGRLFDAEAEYIGWIDEKGRAWNSDGTYLGEVVEENYVLRNTSKVPLMSRIPRIAPISPIPPISTVNRVGRAAKAGWIDALAEL